ncbi:hypothetical protein FB446DRAFT_795779 [Lentinula raphanica]|nr:hypothetical protein FB446DRAFT_795779 [Lentinula raphanica]
MFRVSRYVLAWDPYQAGHILGASKDMTALSVDRDVQAYSKENTAIPPTTMFRGHTSVVNDVDWHPKKDHLFASVGDDKMPMRSANGIF